ncbi:MAG: hypothetical protein KDG55_11180 [Rhodocyclaceae bacterium]|nr:hypothetical protein [Rhodocyclaceae bacterium]
MSQPNARLKLQFDLDLMIPDTLLSEDHSALCRDLCEILGATVMQGLPAISKKQLAKAQVGLLSHHHHVEVENLRAPSIPLELARMVTAHLTDAEITVLCGRAATKAPNTEPELLKYLRRQALALVSEYRLVPCTLNAVQTSGVSSELKGNLNLTNGSVMLTDEFRKVRLKSDQGPIPVTVEGMDATVQASLSGHTLSGPVLAVEVMHLVPHRAHLVGLWQQA